LVIDLDPLRNISEEEKLLRMAQKGNSQKEYVISSHIEDYVWKAMEEHEDFVSKDFDEQMEILVGYADEFIKENGANNGIGTTAPQDPGAVN
jgi:hypothetical protein